MFISKLFNVVTGVCLVSLFGCSGTKSLPVDITLTRDRLIPVALPARFANHYIFVECDSARNLQIKRQNSNVSPGVESSVKQHLNGIEIEFKTLLDTIYVKVTDTLILKPVAITEIKEVNHLTWYQKLLIGLGLIYIGMLIIKIKKRWIK